MPHFFAAETNYSQSGPVSVKRVSKCSSTKEMATGLKVGLRSSFVVGIGFV